ncbi:hypothetical protein chiPu_0005074 [Chiloscyllium punctatum]|uniref:Uncharacterized protein n=1 Tax=Chiloscyllium punctatum TaxID=137246 RepID=A0A401S8G1_CHIPU|nr:hypothetical protein [Chiloscyllium punctatum]
MAERLGRSGDWPRARGGAETAKGLERRGDSRGPGAEWEWPRAQRGAGTAKGLEWSGDGRGPGLEQGSVGLGGMWGGRGPRAEGDSQGSGTGMVSKPGTERGWPRAWS